MSHSEPYNYDLPAHLKCWTSCPLRISKYESVAVQATSELLQDWRDQSLPTISDPHLKLQAGKYGHLMAVSLPEALPDRIGPLSKMIDLLLLADGTLEEGIEDTHKLTYN
jgi:hypothetical protein